MDVFVAELLCLIGIILAGIAASVVAGLMIEQSERRECELHREADAADPPQEQANIPDSNNAER